MNKETFINELAKLNINLSEKQLWQLNKYYELLIEWNEKINLTRIIDEEQVYLKHFYDSLTLCKVINLDSKLSLCDIGTGAGFPGIVLKIAFPTLSVTLIDSLNKRIIFLNEVIKELELTNIEAIHIRGEEFARRNREKYDVVTSRAVSNLRILSEICLPLCKVNGFFIAMKSNSEEEIAEANTILRNLDSEIIQIESFLLPFEESRRDLIKIRKNKITSHKYPRQFNIIKNKKNRSM